MSVVQTANTQTKQLIRFDIKTISISSEKLRKRFIPFLRNDAEIFDSTFVTFDVTSLYTNIPKELGLEALSFWIDRFQESLTESRFTKEFTIAGFEVVLTFNYFMFDGKWYLQIKGVTMGTKAAVILAILTVGYLEIKLYTILPNYFSSEYTKYINEHWKRFIDDCFITWKKNESSDLFEEILNNLHPSIKLTKDTDDDRIP